MPSLVFPSSPLCRRFLSQIPYQWLVNLFVVLILSGVVPGLSFAIMGGKLPDPQLRTFAYAGISRVFLLRVYPDVAPVWQYINRNLEQGALILTHDIVTSPTGEICKSSIWMTVD